MGYPAGTVVGDFNDLGARHAIKFSNYEIISHNAEYCCGAHQTTFLRDSIRNPFPPLRTPSPGIANWRTRPFCFTQISAAVLRYNSSHVHRSASRTLGTAVRSPGRVGA